MVLFLGDFPVYELNWIFFLLSIYHVTLIIRSAKRTQDRGVKMSSAWTELFGDVWDLLQNNPVGLGGRV